MVESAGGRGRAGPGPPPARRRSRRRGELSAARAARLPAHPRPGREGAMASRSAGMKRGFCGRWPLAAEAAGGEAGVPERPG